MTQNLEGIFTHSTRNAVFKAKKKKKREVSCEMTFTRTVTAANQLLRNTCCLLFHAHQSGV